MAPDGEQDTGSSVSVTVPLLVFGGLMVLQHNNQTLNGSTFDNLSFG